MSWLQRALPLIKEYQVVHCFLANVYVLRKLKLNCYFIISIILIICTYSIAYGKTFIAYSLKEAQQQPESHRDLIVRVAGYSAYFIQLGKVIQDEVIGRTEHQLNM